MGEIKPFGLVGEVLAERPTSADPIRGVTRKEWRDIIENNGFLFVRPYTRYWRKHLPDTAIQVDDDVLLVINGPARIGFYCYGCRDQAHTSYRDIRVIYLDKDEKGKVWVRIYLK